MTTNNRCGGRFTMRRLHVYGGVNCWGTTNPVISKTVERRRLDDRWTAVNAIFQTLIMDPDVWLPNNADGTKASYPAWWDVGMIFMPIMESAHWVLGVLDLLTLTVTVYDSQ